MAEKYGVKAKFNMKLEEVREGSIICRDVTTDETVELPCDSLLLAAGLRPRRETAEKLRHLIPETDVFIVGDARHAESIATAVADGFGAASEL